MPFKKKSVGNYFLTSFVMAFLFSFFFFIFFLNTQHAVHARMTSPLQSELVKRNYFYQSVLLLPQLVVGEVSAVILGSITPNLLSPFLF